MKEFSVHVQEGRVVRRSPDPVEAQALIAQARERLKDLHTLPINRQNARFRFEDAYEVLREALQAFLSSEGFKPYSHEAVFSFALERGLLPEGLVRQGDRSRDTEQHHLQGNNGDCRRDQGGDTLCWAGASPA